MAQVATTIESGSIELTIRNTVGFIMPRLAFASMVLLSIIFLTYFGLDMAQGEPFAVALTAALPRTAAYLGRLLQGDLGMSTAITSTFLPHSINDALAEVLTKSFGLLGISLLFATIVGVLLGTIAATRRSRSLIILLVSIIGISAPSFFVALLLQMFVLRLTRETGSTFLPVGGFGWDSHLILPALVLAARPIAQITRITYITISDILQKDFVGTAHSKGLKPHRILWWHVFRNATVPILTTISVSLRFSLSSLPVVEFFFGWGGIGFLLLKAISQQDENLTIALLLSLGLLFIAVNFLLEIAYRLVDPRLRDIPEHVAAGERQTVREAWRGLISWLWELGRLEIGDWRSEIGRLRGWLRWESGGESDRLRLWRKATLRNVPLLLGMVLVAGLVVIFVWGPALAPLSPFTTRGLEIVDGEFIVPPFEPGVEFRWGTDVIGRDMFSLILAGAQQTLLLAALVVLARLIVGFVLGAIAGWFRATWLDRTILGLAEIVAAFPTLLLTMMLILAFGIRNGFRPFLIAFCVVGWGEIMQFVRGAVIEIRPKPYIESAIAVGARTSRIVTQHMLPNLLSALISLAALEMGAVLLLLGELGFLNIFIGGGAFAELDVGGAPYHYSDVPEWGSLLSNVRPYARSYSWTAIYPSLAFFIAIIGFNLFGEGLRQLVQVVGAPIARLFNRWTLVAAILVFFIVGWVQENTGAIVFYREQSAEFNTDNALNHLNTLTDPRFEGRTLDSDGVFEAAEYIADHFAEIGLQAGGEEFTYFQQRTRDYTILNAVPHLSIKDGTNAPIYRENYVEFAGQFANFGEATGTVRVFARDELTAFRGGFFNFGVRLPALDEVDFSKQVLMVFDPADAFLLNRYPRLGTLIVTDDATRLAQNRTLSARDPIGTLFGTGRQVGVQIPEMWIDAATANRILGGTGETVASVRRQADNLEVDEILEFSAEQSTIISITGTVKTREPIVHVVGHLPGLAERNLNNQVIVVMAQYDRPPTAPDGALFPSANDNASGVAVLLEVARTLQQSGYQPYKTILFVAYSGQGQEGGNWVYPPDVAKFLQAKYGFSSAFEVEAVIDIRAVGAGDGDQLAITTGGSLRLADLIDRSAEQVAVGTTRVDQTVDLSTIFSEGSAFDSGQEAPQIRVSWNGWDATARTVEDTVEGISAEKLDKSGRAITLALMLLGRETDY